MFRVGVLVDDLPELVDLVAGHADHVDVGAVGAVVVVARADLHVGARPALLEQPQLGLVDVVLGLNLVAVVRELGLHHGQLGLQVGVDLALQPKEGNNQVIVEQVVFSAILQAVSVMGILESANYLLVRSWNPWSLVTAWTSEG